MFETRCWTKNPLVLWPTLTEAVAEEQKEDTTMVIERNRFCAECKTLIRRSLNTWSLSLFLCLFFLSLSFLTGEISKPSFRVVRGSWQRSLKEGNPDLLLAGMFLEDLLIERSTCCISLSSLFRTLVNADVSMVFNISMVFKISKFIDFRIDDLQKDWMGDL